MSSLLAMLSVLLIITAPPTPPTLFPYTTLFRSQLGLRPREAPGAAREARGWRRRHQGRGGHRDRDEGEEGAGRGRPQRHAGRRDRKSTRLNSSHLGISYAVFCLKKKKRKKTL